MRIILVVYYNLTDNRLATGSNDNYIQLWNTTTHKCRGTLGGHRKHNSVLIQLNDGGLALKTVV